MKKKQSKMEKKRRFERQGSKVLYIVGEELDALTHRITKGTHVIRKEIKFTEIGLVIDLFIRRPNIK